jgi:RNA polymerase sigma factor (sigma-70 family)
MSTSEPASTSPSSQPVATPARIEAWFVKYYDSLRAAARAKRRLNDTLAATEVADEAYLKMREHMPTVRTEVEFLAALRQHETHILLNSVRKRNAEKRWGGVRGVALTDDVAVPGQHAVIDFAVWQELMTDLAQRLPEAYLVVGCRIDFGMKQSEIAKHLGISERTVRNRLRQVRGWMEQRRKDET